MAPLLNIPNNMSDYGTSPNPTYAQAVKSIETVQQ